MIWSYQLNKSQYLELFQEHNKLCTLRPVQKYWYKDRFEWRLSFWFSTDQKRSSRRSVEWVNLLNHLREEGYRYRFRSESYNCLFVNNTEILDFILNSNYVNYLIDIEYTDDDYIKILSSQKSLENITNIKFVKKITKYRYKIKFDYFDYRTDYDTRDSLTRYIKENISLFDVQGRNRNSLAYRTIGNGFEMYTKSLDDIMVLHMIAPGKIASIVKLMEKNNEDNIS